VAKTEHGNCYLLETAGGCLNYRYLAAVLRFAPGCKSGLPVLISGIKDSLWTFGDGGPNPTRTAENDRQKISFC